MKVYVGGVNGVGKSTLLRAAAERLGCDYIHATTYLLDHLGFGSDYEKLRALPPHIVDEQYALCIEKLFNRHAQKFFLLDAHYLVLVRGTIYPQTASWINRFDALALITAPLEDLWKRITGDTSMRDRALFHAHASEQEKKELLKLYLKQTEEEFLRLAAFYSMPHFKMVNAKDSLQSAINNFVSHINQLPKKAEMLSK